MILRRLTLGLLVCAAALFSTGCETAPGKPKSEVESVRPEQVTDFATLYGENCAACHGANGHNGAAISLANPVYLATAGVDNIQRVTSSGVAGTMMPGFGKASGGMLTDQQIGILAQGMMKAWANSSALSSQTPPPYASKTAGDAASGEKTFGTYCARCHGADGSGQTGKSGTGSLIDPAYLSLISDQGLRSILIAGMPEQGMPDWRSDGPGTAAHSLSDQEITDLVAWLASHRVATPGQPYQQHP